MIPGPWEFVLLALGAWRVWRLVAIDDLAPIARARERLVGAKYSVAAKEWRFLRPTLAHFIECPFCSGFWLTLAWWSAWSVWPHWALVAAAPFALSATVGLVQHRLG